MIKVFYSGVWDLLHYGHLRALVAARQLGDWLTVGVITDDYKHWAEEVFRDALRTPVISYGQRAEIVASLRCVDEVVPHRSIDDNVDFIVEQGFSIRAHGPEHGLYSLQVAARSRLELAGVKYVLIPRTPSISTTLIKERIRRYEEVQVSSNPSCRHACFRSNCTIGAKCAAFRATQVRDYPGG